MTGSTNSVSLGELARALSSARLGPYRARSGSDEETVCLYLHNLALSRELYPILNSVEVALRNTIHASATAHFGTPDWFRDPAVLRHEPRQRSMVDEAQNSLWRDQRLPVARIRRGQVPLPPPSPVDDHVAALIFGFWTGVLNAPYELRLWNAAPGGTNLSHAAFPYAGRRYRQRSVIFPMVNRLRLLRNRVSHNEPILWWQPSLQAEYRSASTVLGWISPAFSQLIQFVDRFAMVYQAGHMQYLNQIHLTT